MAQISSDRQKIESAFMSVYWQFRKEFGEPENEEKYWSEMCNKIDAIGQQFSLDPYVVSVLMVCIDDLEKAAHKKFGPNFRYANYDLVIGTINRMRAKKGLSQVKTT